MGSTKFEQKTIFGKLPAALFFIESLNLLLRSANISLSVAQSEMHCSKEMHKKYLTTKSFILALDSKL